MNKLNACIGIISSRGKCLRKCLESLHNNYNRKYNYPVYVFYFDDIYDSRLYQDEVRYNISSNIHFRSIPYKSPSHVPESEMFYNRKDLWYVSNGSFTVDRKGYLHMCNFRINFYGYANTEFEKYDYFISHDDEAGYSMCMKENPFEKLEEVGVDMGAYITGQRLKDGSPHQGHRDTRVGLWEFTKKFMIRNDVDPKFQQLKDLMDDEDASEKIHYLPWSDSYVFKTDFAKTDLWTKWIEAVNMNGGVYKYRWGDNEIISLFGMMHQKEGIVNLGYVEDGFHNQGMFRGEQNLAPSIKNIEV